MAKENTMKTKVWEVKLGDPANPTKHNTITNVAATTLRKAIAKAEKAERELCAQMAEDEGEKFTADKAIAVKFLLEID